MTGECAAVLLHRCGYHMVVASWTFSSWFFSSVLLAIGTTRLAWNTMTGIYCGPGDRIDESLVSGEWHTIASTRQPGTEPEPVITLNRPGDQAYCDQGFFSNSSR